MKQLPINLSKQFSIGHGTHTGMIRTVNEDSYKALCYRCDDSSEAQTLYLNMVADGVGGGEDGKRASLLVIETIESYFDDLETIAQKNILAHICQAVASAQTAIEELADQDEEFHGGTTVAIFAVLNDALFTSHIGTDRIYLLRDGELYRLSKDHTFRQKLIDAGLITPEEARTIMVDGTLYAISPESSAELDQVMQSPPATQFEHGMRLQRGDKVLVCSDGLTSVISDSEIKMLLIEEKVETQRRVRRLIESVNVSGGYDNTTAILLEVVLGSLKV